MYSMNQTISNKELNSSTLEPEEMAGTNSTKLINNSLVQAQEMVDTISVVLPLTSTEPKTETKN
jgi:hypothetical protein